MKPFPNEVLECMFSFLSVYDRLTASLVCKQWLHVTGRKHLLEDIYVVFEDDTEDGTEIFSSTTREFSCFKFVKQEIDAHYIEFLKKFNTQIHSLSFVDCVLDRQALESSGKLGNYPNLKCLRIIGSKMFDLFSFSFPNLRELYVDSGAYLTDTIMQDLDNTMPKLKVLSLANQKINPILSKAFYHNGSKFKKSSSKTILSFSVLKLFISNRAETIRGLDLEELDQLSASKFIQLSKIENLKLQCMTFECALNCINYLPKFCKEQPYLKSINLDFVDTLKDDNLKLVCLMLPDLEEISIKCYSHLYDSAKYIFQLKKLQYLDISGCHVASVILAYRASMSPFFQAIEESQLDNLKVLRASDCNIIEIVGIKLLQKVPYLVDLDLSSCKIGDKTLKIISKCLIHLKYLNLEDCFMITDKGLIGKIQPSCTAYREENISKPLSNIKGLEKLNLSGCYLITDASFIQAIQFQYLQELYLDGCKISHSAMLLMYLNNPCLRKVIHSNCMLKRKYESRDDKKGKHRSQLIRKGGADEQQSHFLQFLIKCWRFSHQKTPM